MLEHRCMQIKKNKILMGIMAAVLVDRDQTHSRI